jgi:tetratricopeptide (TPR) repeat protein
MRRLLRIVKMPGVLLGLLLLIAAGCDRTDRLSLGTETSEPYYRQGDQLKRQGRYQEALAAYLKVIEKRNEDAPESHMEAGLIYLQFLKDPIYAIYHFRKYLELEPNSRQAELVRLRIDAATRDFARSLPARPMENQTLRLDLMARIDELQKENASLREEIAGVHPGVLGSDGDSDVTLIPVPESAASPGITLGPSFAPAPGNTVSVKPAPPSGKAPAVSAAKPPPAGGRTHIVAQGETLYIIAQHYYGSGAKWPAILDANRDVLKNENAVHPGMTLKIP